MENGILIGLSSQSTLRRQFEVIANNIANANTTGFKRERALLAPYLSPRPVLDTNAAGKPVFVQDVATIGDFSAGYLDHTGSPLDLALRSDGFFVIEGETGNRYSRDGHFRLDEQGRLVTSDGRAVLGEGNTPIIVPPGVSDVTVTADGTIAAGGQPLGRVQVVRFANPATLKAIGGGLWQSAEVPTQVDRPVVVQGMLERSNVQPILEIEQMIRVHRAYEQAKQLVDQEDERIKKMLQVYGS